MLGTSRTNPYKKPEDVGKVIDNYKKLKLDALVAIGGEDTLGVANKLVKENKGLNIVGCPKTIDNDLSGTDCTFGFDTAINIVTEAIDRLQTTADSHHRVMVIEVMGRHAGWIALHSGIAGSADYILIPEVPINIDEVCDVIKRQHKRGKLYSIIVAAEGAQFGNDMVTKDQKLDAFGHVILGGIGERLEKIIEEKTGFEARSVVLGHLQRGGAPSAFDRIVGTKFGLKAIDMILAKKFGYMASLQGTEVKEVPIEVAVGKLKTVDLKSYELAKVFFG
jgi:6-phosphofructokinase 1